MDHWSRRQYVRGMGVAGLGLPVGCGRLPGQASLEIPKPTKVPRVGYLVGAASDSAPGVAAFRQGLAELGYVEGQTIVIEYRFAQGQVERLPELVADLVRLPVDIIVTAGSPPTQAARSATSTIPIVQTSGANLVALGLADSLAHPGGNVTGQNSLYAELTGKRLEFLHAIVPGMSRVGVLWSGNLTDELREAESAAQLLGVASHSLRVPEDADLEGVFETAVKERIDALLVLAGSILFANAARTAGLAAHYRLPAMYVVRSFVDVGGLMSYAPNQPAMHRRAATYVDRILKGAKPADLPVEQPREFDFVLNLKTAQALGLTIPEPVLLQATEVIQ